MKREWGRDRVRETERVYEQKKVKKRWEGDIQVES